MRYTISTPLHSTDLDRHMPVHCTPIPYITIHTHSISLAIANTPTRVRLRCSRFHSHGPRQLSMAVCRQWLGEHVSHHVVGADVRRGDGAGRHLLSDVVVLDVDVFGALVVFRVLAQCDGTLAVRVDGGGVGRRQAELGEERTPPHCLTRSLCGCHVLCFHG